MEDFAHLLHAASRSPALTSKWRHTLKTCLRTFTSDNWLYIFNTCVRTLASIDQPTLYICYMSTDAHHWFTNDFIHELINAYGHSQHWSTNDFTHSFSTQEHFLLNDQSTYDYLFHLSNSRSKHCKHVPGGKINLS